MQHLDAVESVHMTLGVAVFNPLTVVARVIWIFDHVVLVKSVYRLNHHHCGRRRTYSKILHGKPRYALSMVWTTRHECILTMNGSEPSVFFMGLVNPNATMHCSARMERRAPRIFICIPMLKCGPWILAHPPQLTVLIPMEWAPY